MPRLRVTALIIAAVVGMCVGALLGTTWTTQVLHRLTRQHAEERRKLNEEREALRIERERQGWCPRCSGPLSYGPGAVLFSPVVEPERS